MSMSQASDLVDLRESLAFSAKHCAAVGGEIVSSEVQIRAGSEREGKELDNFRLPVTLSGFEI
jgi:hypothetical protein